MLWSRLKDRGVIGLNYRNSELIMRLNPRHLFPLVDDKLITKRLAIEAGIAVPDLYSTITSQIEIEEFVRSRKFDDFVIKPGCGSGGEGIVVVTGMKKSGFQKADGSIIGFNETSDHLSRILSGVYSLGAMPDKALVEYRVKFDPVFEPVSYLGVPDIRVIVFKGVPILAMLRLPTRTSSGKANLHQGAVGAGIRLSDGETTYGVCLGKACEEHPDTGNLIRGVIVPHWEKLLKLAARSYELTGLGYQGVDLVLDRQMGPLLLELNARPGLAIQIANRVGIMSRVRVVEKLELWKESLDVRVARVRELFASSD
jgi:alpha-L-glutamate ligase-like protein